MAMYNLNFLAYYNVSEEGKKRKDGREGCLAVDDEERAVVDFQAVGEVSHSCSTSVCMCDDDDFVTAVDEFLRVLAQVCELSTHFILRSKADIYDSPLLLLLFSRVFYN